MSDYSEYVSDPESMPLCPFCDQPLLEFEELGIIRAHGLTALAHRICIEDCQHTGNTGKEQLIDGGTPFGNEDDTGG